MATNRRIGPRLREHGLVDELNAMHDLECCIRCERYRRWGKGAGKCHDGRLVFNTTDYARCDHFRARGTGLDDIGALIVAVDGLFDAPADLEAPDFVDPEAPPTCVGCAKLERSLGRRGNVLWKCCPLEDGKRRMRRVWFDGPGPRCQNYSPNDLRMNIETDG